MLRRLALRLGIGTLLCKGWSAHAADCDPGAGYFQVSTKSQLDKITSCEFFQGSLTLSFDVEGWNKDDAFVDLGDVATINGSLNIYPSNLYEKTTIIAPKLRNITKKVSIYYYNTTSRLDSVNVTFPQLEYVGDSYITRIGTDELILLHESELQVNGVFRVWDSTMADLELPSLSRAFDGFSIDQNPALSRIDAIDLTTVKGYELLVANNKALRDIDFRNLTRAEASVVFESNPELEEIELPKLEYASRLQVGQNGRQTTLSLPQLVRIGNTNTTTSINTVKDVVKLDMNAVANVTGNLLFSGNMFGSLVLPSLYNATGKMTVEKNQVIGTLACPRLQTLGDLVVKANVLLTNVTFNSLRKVESIDMAGNFTNVEFFGLEEVTGDFELRGDSTMDCSWFDENFFQKIVKGAYNCVGNHTKPEGGRFPSTGYWEPTIENPLEDENDQSSTPADTNSSSSRLSAGSKAGIGVGVSLGAIILFAGLLFLWRRRGRPVQAPEPRLDQEFTKPELDATPMSGDRAVSHNNPKTRDAPQELAAEGRVAELA